jgi:hypothetical protein
MARSLFHAERMRLADVLAMRTGHSNRTARPGAGIFVILAVQGLCAPVSAWAGCGHQVSLRADRTQSDLRVDGLLDRIAGPANPLQEPRRSCSGSWCSEHPAPPAAPLGLDDWGFESWAFFGSHPGAEAPLRYFAFAGRRRFHASHCGTAVFHPPRCRPAE